MSIENNNLPPASPPPPGGQGNQGEPGQPNKEGTFSQEFRHQPVSARVPERLTRGVLSTGVLVLDGPNEFVLDFMQALTRPFGVAARVVLTPAVMEQFVAAVRDNISRYEQRFGGITPLPKPPTDRRPTLQEIYDEFKLAEDQMSGNYANAVMVGHSASEFFFDFITNFYPTSAVSSRVFLSAPQMPRLLDAVTVAFNRFRERVNQARQQQQPPQNPPQPPPQQPPPT
jgi:hypothetical protein